MTPRGLPALLVSLARRANLGKTGDLRRCHFPPRLVRRHALVSVRLDRDHVRAALAPLGFGERGAKLSDAPDPFGHGTEARGVRGEVDRERIPLWSLAVESQ